MRPDVNPLPPFYAVHAACVEGSTRCLIQTLAYMISATGSLYQWLAGGGGWAMEIGH